MLNACILIKAAIAFTKIINRVCYMSETGVLDTGGMTGTPVPPFRLSPIWTKL
jgi:hypothetical protein